MEARKISIWRGRYLVTEGGRELTIWDSSIWRGGGEFELGGTRFRVRANGWGTKYTMTDHGGGAVASAQRVGRKWWTVEAGGYTYQFRRRSAFSSEQELILGDTRVGSVRKASLWGSEIAVDLPGLPPAIQIFVLGVVISMWEAQSAAAASASAAG